MDPSSCFFSTNVNFFYEETSLNPYLIGEKMLIPFILNRAELFFLPFSHKKKGKKL